MGHFSLGIRRLDNGDDDLWQLCRGDQRSRRSSLCYKNLRAWAVFGFLLLDIGSWWIDRFGRADGRLRLAMRNCNDEASHYRGERQLHDVKEQSVSVWEENGFFWCRWLGNRVTDHCGDCRMCVVVYSTFSTTNPQSTCFCNTARSGRDRRKLASLKG
jgi:hypothetical protein